jgi:hypothetical protein
MAVAHAAERHEQVAGLDLRVSMETPVALNAALAFPPVRPRRSRQRSRGAQPRSASVVSATSSKGWVTPATIWPCSCPLPAMTTTSPSCSMATAARIAALTVADLHHLGPRAAQDLGADRGRVFATGIVVGDDGHVGQPRGDLAHDRPLAAVAVAAGAEDADQPATGVGAQRLQHRLQAIRRVGVIDIGLAAARLRADALQSARRAFQRFHRPSTRSPALARRDAQARRHQGVRGLEGAGQRQEDRVDAPAGVDRRRWPSGVALRSTSQAGRARPRPSCPGRRHDSWRRRSWNRRRNPRSAPRSGRAARGCRTGEAWPRDRWPCRRGSRGDPGSGSGSPRPSVHAVQPALVDAVRRGFQRRNGSPLVAASVASIARRRRRRGWSGRAGSAARSSPVWR